jgi:MarC family membrane protein
VRGAYNPLVTAELVSSALLLFLVVDPIGNIPIVLAAMAPVASARRSRVLLREVAFATLLLLLFLFFGKLALDTLRLSELSLRIAGGVVLFLIALRMVFPSEGGTPAASAASEPLLVPIAVPALAGPSALATVMLMNAQTPGALYVHAGSVVAVMTVCGLILLAAAPIARAVGERGIKAAERLMGLVLVAVSVQMMLDGVALFVRGLR